VQWRWADRRLTEGVQPRMAALGVLTVGGGFRCVRGAHEWWRNDCRRGSVRSTIEGGVGSTVLKVPGGEGHGRKDR